MNEILPSIIKVSELFQVGIVVHDLDKSIRHTGAFWELIIGNRLKSIQYLYR